MNSGHLFFIILTFVLLLFSLSFHESAHAYVADYFGDDTARLLGRVSLNPIPHIDLVGTIIFPLVLMTLGMPIFGWAKPVPVNVMRLRDPRWDSMKVSAAGPLSNLLLSVIFAILFHVVRFVPAFQTEVLITFLVLGIQLNLLLAVFNLIPIPPLDGSGVMSSLLPTRLAVSYDQFGARFGFYVLFALIYFRVLGRIVIPPVRFLSHLLGVGGLI